MFTLVDGLVHGLLNVVTSQLRQADKLGLKAGQRIIRVGHRPYTRGRMSHAQKGSQAYSITLKEPSTLAILVSKVAVYAAIPAGILGWLMLFFLPCIIHSRQQRTSGWHLDVLSKGVVLTVAPLAAVASGGVQLFSLILDWPYASAITKVHELNYLCFVIGCLIGLRCLRNPLLQEALDGDAARAVRRLDIAAGILCWLFVACDATWAWITHERLDVTHLLADLQDSASAYLLLTFTWTASRVSAVVQQRIVQLGKAIPCDSHEFAQRVHVPCADMLNDVGPKLASFGWTLLLMSPYFLTSCFLLYISTQLLVDLASVATARYWLSPARRAVGSAAVFLAIVIGPFTLSDAMKHLQRRLNELRCRDASLSTQVEGVERMIANLNDGHGFGIPVFEGLVLTRSLLEKMLIQAVLAGTVIKAFVDTAEGFNEEKAEDEVLGSQLAHVAALLQNITNASMALQQKPQALM